MRAYEFLPDNDIIPEEIDGRPTRNNLGKLIHHTSDGIKNFWKWFGDSIVVDESNRPIVCYHGTDKNFDIFDKDVSWFSYDSQLASDYAELRYSDKGGSNVMLCYIRAYRPFDANVVAKGSGTISAFITNMSTQARKNGVTIDDSSMIAALRRLQSLAKEEESGPYYSAKDFWHYPSTFFGREGAIILSSLFNSLQFDSILYTEDGSSTIGVFDKSSIKSVFNPGKYSSSFKIHESE